MTEEYVANATRGFDSERNIRELHQALLSTQGVAEFLHEMAILAARLVGAGLYRTRGRDKAGFRARR